MATTEKSVEGQAKAHEPGGGGRGEDARPSEAHRPETAGKRDESVRPTAGPAKSDDSADLVQHAEAPDGLTVEQLKRVITETWQGMRPQPSPAVLENALGKADEVDDKGKPKNQHKDSDSAKSWAEGLLVDKSSTR